MRNVLSHVDMRVRDRKRARAFYGAIFDQLSVVFEAEGEMWTSFVSAENKTGDWFAFTEDAQMVAGPARVAFAAASRDEVDRVATVLDSIGAQSVEGPSEAYGPNYYAVFFEDPDGNKLEVCFIAFE